ncbi:mitotic-spindle organizing protein associated with a ring of gamma-tubulin 1 [Diplocarpon rosae]|nr:mitotic-spindle organizing protein associated with a ring of gamma-tubulin 1 [Diplocarpon rosae]
MPSEPASKKDQQASAAQAREVIDVFHEISTLLNADLDRQTLSICISLIENGVNPEALAVCGSGSWEYARLMLWKTVIRELRKDAEETRAEIQNSQ